MASSRLWLILVVVAAVLREDAEANLTIMPANISAIAGETVTLRCAAIGTSYTFLYWSKGHEHLSLGEALSHGLDNDLRSRYSLIGNYTNGEYDLRIENIKKSDAGDYQCSYIGSAGGKASPPATITVYVPPRDEYPLCNVQVQTATSGATGTLWPGDAAEFTCQSAGGDPPALLQWARSNHSILEPQPSNIVYARILLPEDNGVRFTCVATSPALRKPRKCSVMPMRILPVVQVRPLTRRIIPGDNATFDCEGSAIPHVASYSWRVAGRHISDGQPGYSFANQKQLLTIHDVKSTQDQLEVACEASTPTGIVEHAAVKMVVMTIDPPVTVTEENAIDFIPKPPGTGVGGSDAEEDEPTGILNGNFFMIVLTTFGALVVLLLVVAVVMGCWALHAKGKRPQTQKRPRVECHESTVNTIDMDPLPLPTQLMYEPPTTISADPMAVPTAANTVADQENAPGYISQLYSKLDTSRLPARTVFSGYPEKPVAQITPTTQGVALTLPRSGKIDKPSGTDKPTVKECPASFSIPEEKAETPNNQSSDENDKKKDP